jgi:hypothetical protein
MMNGSVAVHMDVNMNLDLQSRDLLGDLIEAIGRGGTIRECERSRRRDDAGKIDQRDQARDAATCPAGHNSKHRITTLDQSVLRTTRGQIVPAWRPFGKIGRGTEAAG